MSRDYTIRAVQSRMDRAMEKRQRGLSPTSGRAKGLKKFLLKSKKKKR